MVTTSIPFNLDTVDVLTLQIQCTFYALMMRHKTFVIRAWCSVDLPILCCKTRNHNMQPEERLCEKMRENSH